MGTEKFESNHLQIANIDLGRSADENQNMFFDSKIEKRDIIIGGQAWMADNLKVNAFCNGDPILHVKTEEDWVKAANNGQPAWCWPTNDLKKREEYGKLYNGYAVQDKRGLAPEGYHIPTEGDLIELIVTGKIDPEMKFPRSGNRFGSEGSLSFVGYCGLYWSSTKDGNKARFLFFNSSDASINTAGLGLGFAVRCLRY